jgi:hypothetical protein
LDNGNGQLGGFDCLRSSNLFQIKFFDDKKIKDFYCAAQSSYILISYFFYFLFFLFFFFIFFFFILFFFLDDGTVFSFGSNSLWDLHLGISTTDQNTPQKIKFENDEKIETIFS